MDQNDMRESLGGDEGIRTPDTLWGYNDLANRRLQPLGHVSCARSTRIDVALPVGKHSLSRGLSSKRPHSRCVSLIVEPKQSPWASGRSTPLLLDASASSFLAEEQEAHCIEVMRWAL